MYDDRIDELKDQLEELERREFLAREGAEILLSQAQEEFARNALRFREELRFRQRVLRGELDRLYRAQEEEFRRHIKEQQAEFNRMIKGVTNI